MMQVSKKIPFDDPQVLMLVRGGYVLSNLIIMGIYAYVHWQINKKKGTYLHPLLCYEMPSSILRTALLTAP